MPNLQARQLSALVDVDNGGQLWGFKMPDGREIPIAALNLSTGQPEIGGNPLPSGGGGGLPVPTATNSLTATTHATPTSGAYVAFGDMACTELYVENTGGVSIDYQRGGAGGFWTIEPGAWRRIVGITNASQIGVRRTDWANPNQPVVQIDVRAVAVQNPQETFAVAGILNLAVTLGGSPTTLPAQACTAAELGNSTNRDLQYRTSSTSPLVTLRAGTSVIVTGITNTNQIAVQPVGSIADGGAPPLCIEAFTSGLKGTLQSQPAGAISANALVRLGDINLPSTMRTGNGLAMGEMARGPVRALVPRMKKVIAEFTTVANMVGNTAQCADVTTGDITRGTSAIEYTQTGTSVARFCPSATMAAALDVTGGHITITVSFPVGTSDYNVTNALTSLRVQLHSAGTPASPTANYHEAVLTPSTPAFINGAKVSPMGRVFSFSMKVDKFVAVGTGATLTAITFAQFTLQGGSAGNGAKFRPHLIEYVPNHMTKGTLIISCDDFRASVWDVLYPIMERYSAPGVCFGDPWVSPGRSGKLTWDQLRRMNRYSGWEIAGQNFYRETAEAQAVQQIKVETSKQYIAAMLAGIGGSLRNSSYGSNTVTNFADFNKDVMINTCDCAPIFQNALNSTTDPFKFAETAPVGDLHFLRRWSGSSWGAGTRAAGYQFGVDQAIADKGLFMLGFHAETDTAGNEFMLAVESTLAYCRDPARAANIQIVTLEEFMRQCYTMPSAGVTTF